METTVLLLRASLFHFYWSWAQEHPDKQLTQLVDLTSKMLGSAETPSLNTKGAETWGFFLFLISILQVHKGKVPNGALVLQACRDLEAIITMFDDHGISLPEATIKATIQATIHNKQKNI